MRPPASDDEREVRELLAGAERPVVVPPFSAVRRRGARASLVPQLLSAALVVVAAAALGLALRELRNAATTAPTPPAASSPAATASTVPTATPSPPPPLSDRYGLVVGGRSPYIRSETDPAHVDLPGDLDQASVSPDGGKVAYWQYASTGAARVLTVVDTIDPTRPRSLLTLPDTEVAATSTFGGVVWSSDGQGLLIAVNSRDYVQQAVPDAPNVYVALRQVDLATGGVREIAREAPGFPYYPIAWDRARGISAAGRWGPGGFTGGFVTIRDGAPSQGVTFPSTTLPRFVSAAPDASRVFAHNFYDSDPHALYVWSIADSTARSTLSAVGSERIARAIWRNAREIVVSLSRGPGFEDGDRLEVWSLDGSRRVVMDAKHRLDAVRPDGTAAITSKGVVDLATGASAEMPDGPRAVASVLLKQGARTTPPTAGASPTPSLAPGAITGRLGYPSDFIPALTVYAISVNDPNVFFSVDFAGVGNPPRPTLPPGVSQPTYTLTGIAPGTYYVVAYRHDNNPGIGVYTQYTANCEQATQSGATATPAPDCPPNREADLSLRPVRVGAGETVTRIDIIDWVPQNGYPQRPR